MSSSPDEKPVPEQGQPEKKRSKAGTAFLVIAIVVLVAVVSYVVYSLVNTQVQARRDLEQAIELVRTADEAVLAVDEVILAEITPALARAAEEASAQIPAAQDRLDEALELLDGAIEELTEDDAAIATALEEAARARLEMLEESTVLLEANSQAAAAIGPAGDGIEALLAAEGLADEAVEKYNQRTKEGVTASTELTNRGIEQLDVAKAEFEEAAAAYPSADLSTFLEYIEAKKALMETSREIDELWLAGKLEEANDLVDEYNERDRTVAELGEALPESETVPIAAAYDSDTADAAERYFEARDRAADADTRLRVLLGDAEKGDASEEPTSTSEESTSTEETTGTDVTE